MKVLILGGTGVFGKSFAALLAKNEQIKDITLASRHLESARQTSQEIGDKAHAACVDIKNLPGLASIAANYDIIINTAGPTSAVQIPALQAAIQTRVPYCDLGVIGKAARKALQLDSQAKTRKVTAIISTGWFTILSLMAIHASHQLDATDELLICTMFDFSEGSFYSIERSLARSRELGHVETSWDFIETVCGPFLSYRSGQWKQLEPIENLVEVTHPSGYKIIAYPADYPVALTQPDFAPGVKNVINLFSVTPPLLTRLWLKQGQRMAKNEIDMEEAVMTFFETAQADKKRWLTSPPGYPSGYWMWVIARGHKDGRKACYICWPSLILDWTVTTLDIITQHLLKGEVHQYGVLPSEACFELKSFFHEAESYLADEHRGVPLLNERFDWLD
jgi:saccharopine dehydrogenase-like NADP-dependent oxidoreductase